VETCPRARRASAQGHEAASDEWVKPGLIGRVKHLRGEEDLRHASLQDFRDEC
jgi:bifunctional non-homologous end joining protein LigD